MRTIPFFVLDAFSDTPFGGNPAGVFFDDANALAAGEMRRLAGEVSLESAFVSPAEGEADLRLRYFTGATEVPLCGHATVAALTALCHAGRVPAGGSVRVATPVGVLRVDLAAGSDGGVDVTLFQNPPVFGPVLDAAEIVTVAAALGCAPGTLCPAGLPVQRVSTGTPWLLAPVKTRAVVDDAPADFAAVAALSRQHETFGVYVFTPPEQDDKTGILSTWGRCFAPIAGLNEDPVTGSASGALGGYLAAHRRLPGPDGDGLARFVAQQGFAGGRGGTVRVAVGRAAANATSVDTVAVSGSAVLVAEGAFRLP